MNKKQLPVSCRSSQLVDVVTGWIPCETAKVDDLSNTFEATPQADPAPPTPSSPSSKHAGSRACGIIIATNERKFNPGKHCGKTQMCAGTNRGVAQGVRSELVV